MVHRGWFRPIDWGQFAPAGSLGGEIPPKGFAQVERALSQLTDLAKSRAYL